MDWRPGSKWFRYEKNNNINNNILDIKEEHYWMVDKDNKRCTPIIKNVNISITYEDNFEGIKDIQKIIKLCHNIEIYIENGNKDEQH